MRDSRADRGSALRSRRGGRVHIRRRFYVVATAIGASALLATSRVVFSAVHYTGAANLCWLSVTALRSKTTPQYPAPAGLSRSYRQGLFVELGNPKVALFFLALFPQFVDPPRGHTADQTLVLGTAYVAIAAAGDSLYALAAARLGRRVARWRFERHATAALYLMLGGWAALPGTAR